MIIKRTVNDELPNIPYSVGRQRIARYEYAAVRPESRDTDLTEWVNKNIVEGWELIAVDNGVHYFRREEYGVYYEIDGKLIRSRVGK